MQKVLEVRKKRIIFASEIKTTDSPIAETDKWKTQCYVTQQKKSIVISRLRLQVFLKAER